MSDGILQHQLRKQRIISFLQKVKISSLVNLQRIFICEKENKQSFT